MVLMSLLGGRAPPVRPAARRAHRRARGEYFLVALGETQVHLAAAGLLLVLVVLFMPEASSPPAARLVSRPQQASIREEAADELAQDRGLTKSFGGVRAVDDVTVEIAEGRINGLIGPNGSGKTPSSTSSPA
ncbi:hypothetical protein GCM10020219_077250 [Nonomuraea dietziae]